MAAGASYRYGVIVDRGQARYAGNADFTVQGSIASNGTVQASISRGNNRADIQGPPGPGDRIRTVAHVGQFRLLGSLDGRTPRRVRSGVTR